jgi:N-acetylmuramoyl-L-alanine amidase
MRSSGSTAASALAILGLAAGMHAQSAVPAKATRPATIGARPAGEPATLTDIRRELLADAVRVTLVLDGETPFTSAQLGNPPRVVVDLNTTRAVYALKDALLSFNDDVVRHVRVGRQADATTRVVVDLARSARSSVYPVYNPYRLVIDIERPAERRSAPSVPAPLQPTSDRAANPAAAPARTSTRAAGNATTPAATAATLPSAGTSSTSSASPRPQPTGSTSTPPRAPAAPSTNGSGGFSLSRQLGLGVSRVVIDAGHGGHDPGARANGITEAELALDIALRLEKLLQAQRIDVVMTRRTSTFVSLEERTAIANRAGADLFLSIHANASENEQARGIETYYLDFAPDAAAEAIAARENAGSARTMKSLPEFVRTIALNDKVDESREFARFVQEGLFQGVKKTNRQARDLGIKRAPFQVLIGAAMPSILAEISFITNTQEGELLKTEKYRNQIAESLFAGMMAYQGAVKKEGVVVKK